MSPAALREVLLPTNPASSTTEWFVSTLISCALVRSSAVSADFTLPVRAASSVDSPVVRAELSVYRRAGLDPILWPRSAGSFPGYVFTDAPLKLPVAHFGLGHGSGAHAPDEYYVIESTNPKVQGFDGAVRSFVDYLHELAS